MASIMAPVPRVIFTIAEPISLVAAFIAAILDPQDFLSSQISSSTAPPPLSDTARIVTLQLGNLYLLVAFIGVAVLYTTTSPAVVRNYIIALLLGDVGHLWMTYVCMGHARFIDVQGWNKMGWGNIGATAFLFVARTVYLLGGLGKDSVPKSIAKGRKKA